MSDKLKQENHVTEEPSQVERVLDAAIELLAIANMRGDNDIPHPSDGPKLWSVRYQDAWGELEELLEELRPGEMIEEMHAMFESTKELGI